MEQINVVLVEGQALVRQGIATALRSYPDLHLAAEAQDGPQALYLAGTLAPAVILISCDLPSADAFDLTRRIRLNEPGTAVIILTPSEDDEDLFQAIKVGAAGYYHKAASAETLVRAIRRVAGGEYPVNDHVLSRPQVASRVLEQFRVLSQPTPPEAEPLYVPLSNREIDVLDCVARGNSNKATARQLGISDWTVKNHITSILRKLNVNDRTQAVVVSLQHGWIKLH